MSACERHNNVEQLAWGMGDTENRPSECQMCFLERHLEDLMRKIEPICKALIYAARHAPKPPDMALDLALNQARMFLMEWDRLKRIRHDHMG